MVAFRIGFAVVLAFTFGFSEVAGQCFKGCPREMVEEGPVPDEALKMLIEKSDTIFVGTVSSVEPSVPVYPEGEKVDRTAYDKLSDEFKATNVVTFAVDSVWKGERVDTIKLRGDNLLLIYRHTKKFLIFVGKENEKGLRFDLNKSVFGFVDINHPDYHWDVDLGKPGISPTGEWLDKKSYRSNKRLPTDLGPYVMKWDNNNHLWANGDTANWSSGLKKATATKLATLDPKFRNSKRSEEIFSLTTRGCQFTKDEWDRTGGIGFIGWEPCPMPLSLLEAYVKVRIEMEWIER